MAIMAFVLFAAIFMNILFSCMWIGMIRLDKGIISEKFAHKCFHIVILILSILVSHRIFRWSYSHLGGMKHLSGQLKTSKTLYTLLSIASIFFCNLVSIVAAALNFYYNLNWDT